MNKELMKKLSEALTKREELELILEQKIKKEKEDIVKYNDLIEMYVETLSKEFDATLTPAFEEINSDWNLVKRIATKVDTDLFVEAMVTSTFRLGKDGNKVFKSGIDNGSTTKTTINRAKFIEGIKAKANECGINKSVISEMIKADEGRTSEKTIVYEIKGNGK